MTPYQKRLKGSKERIVPASPRLLCELREYWKLNRPGNYLFPGKTPDRPLSSATVQKACKLGIAQAGIQKAATPHTMRHSFATSMLEAGVDVLTISKLLGHSSFVTTMIYLHVRRQHFDRSPSPIDWLPVRQCPKWAEPTQENLTPQPTPEPTPKPAEQTQTHPAFTPHEDSMPNTLANNTLANNTLANNTLANNTLANEEPKTPIRRTSGRPIRKQRRKRK